MRAPFLLTWVSCTLAAAPLVGASGQTVISARDIAAALTRDLTSLGITNKVDEQGYTVPECSPHVSLSAIQFELGKAVLSPDGQAQLEEAAQALHAMIPSSEPAGPPPFRVSLEGHTCSVGKAEDNRVLSEQRAEAVRDYLVGKGFPKDIFEVKGWGEERPSASNHLEAGRRQNRRIDLVLRTRSRPASPSPPGYLNVQWDARSEAQGGQVLQGQEMTSLKTGDGVKVCCQVLEGCHVYGLCLTAEGHVRWLVPREETAGATFGLWWYAGEEHVLPGPENTLWYRVEGAPGMETILLLTSHDPIAKPGNLPASIKKHGAALTSQILRNAGYGANIEVTCIRIMHE